VREVAKTIADQLSPISIVRHGPLSGGPPMNVKNYEVNARFAYDLASAVGGLREAGHDDTGEELQQCEGPAWFIDVLI
jgi:hypothetical protein